MNSFLFWPKNGCIFVVFIHDFKFSLAMFSTFLKRFNIESRLSVTIRSVGQLIITYFVVFIERVLKLDTFVNIFHFSMQNVKENFLFSDIFNFALICEFYTFSTPFQLSYQLVVLALSVNRL